MKTKDEQPAKKPNENNRSQYQDHIKIWDPKSGEIFVKARA